MADNVPTINTGDIVNLPANKSWLSGNPSTSNKQSKSVFDSGKYSIQRYNDVEHLIEIYLENSGNIIENPKRYHINPAAILGLHISDTVTDWVVTGSLTFMYLPEGKPNSQQETTGQPKSTPVDGVTEAAKQNKEMLDSYTFRGDGYDLLRILIMPKTAINEGPTTPDQATLDVSVQQKDTKWMLSYVFSIYEIEDVNDVPELEGNLSTYMKCLKLKFQDLRYHMLKTANIEYSTAMPKDPINVPNTNSDVAMGMGVLSTGEAIRDIFNYVLADPTIGGYKEFKTEFDPENWDKGSSDIFYTSPACDSAADDIDYLYSHHVSETQLKGLEEIIPYDMALLHTDRASEFGFIEPIRLTPLLKIFQKAGKEANNPGDLQKEHFFITSVTKETNVAHMYRAPMGPLNSPNDLKTSKYGEIISYSFVDMSPSINSNAFCTKPVYSVDIKNRTFNVEFRGNTVQEARAVISESYISELFKKGDDVKKLFLPTLHESKKFLNVFPTFSLNGTSSILRQKNGLHDLMYTGIFENACICFQVYGLTLRESGTFIGIDKTTGEEDNDYNNKLYGQWFVVKVDHLFQAGAYLNIIYAVKIHRFKELMAKFEKTY